MPCFRCGFRGSLRLVWLQPDTAAVWESPCYDGPVASDQDRNLWPIATQGRRFAEFFAGIGLVRVGLGRAGWRCVYANDNDPDKAAMYASHFGQGYYDTRDIRGVPFGEALGGEGVLELATASFPCTDLSLAGALGGIRRGQSALFWTFADLIEQMGSRRPRLILLENVVGFLRSNGGADFVDAMERMSELGYAVDPFVLDARCFVPQSRPRVYIVAELGADERAIEEESPLRPKSLMALMRQQTGVRWSPRPLPTPSGEVAALSDVLDVRAPAKEWWPEERRDYLLSQMWPRQRDRLESERNGRSYRVYTAFRRMRVWPDGQKRSTAELRTDGLAGCLRTPKGGSARQIVVRTGRGRIDARYMNVQEAARLMGAGDYRFECGSTQALFALGDAVCVPAISWIEKHALRPRLRDAQGSASRKRTSRASKRSMSRV